MATFGFIGTGNMGGALARAARKRLSGGDEQHGRQKRCSQQGENDRRHRDHPLLVF